MGRLNEKRCKTSTLSTDKLQKMGGLYVRWCNNINIYVYHNNTLWLRQEIKIALGIIN